jgi:hypothetical protein
MGIRHMSLRALAAGGLAVSVFRLASAAAALDTSNELGRLCVAPVPAPTAGEKSLANPSGGDLQVTYSVQVNQRPAVTVSPEHGQWVEGLSTSATRVVSVFADGKRLTSFKFTFQASASNQVCVWRNTLYGTWQLWPLSESRDWCKCEIAAGSPNSAVSPPPSVVTALAQDSKRRAGGRAGYRYR